MNYQDFKLFNYSVEKYLAPDPTRKLNEKLLHDLNFDYIKYRNL